MAYSEGLADRIRTYLGRRKDVEEKKMFGGLCFMVGGKMCVGVVKEELMARIDPEDYEAAIKKPGARPMDFNHKPMAGFVFVADKGIDRDSDLHSWLDLALAFNPKAKSAKKPVSKKMK